jgi:hypothetical protein
MSLGCASHLEDPDLDRVAAALVRACIAAQINGELRTLRGAELDSTPEASGGG